MNTFASSIRLLFSIAVLASFLAFFTTLIFPVSASAQTTNGPVTRAQVLQHLADLEEIGYRSSQASSLRYPYDIEAAEARLAQKKREQTVSGQSLGDARTKPDDSSPATFAPDTNP